MKRNFLFQTTCILVIILFYIPSYAQTISSTELIKDAKQYDGKNVTFRGEAVGDIMIRGEHAWLSVNDGSNAIGIWIDKELINNIQYVGSYEIKGDIVEVTGVFKRACPEHGGDLDLHAYQIIKIASGESLPKTRSLKKIYIALLLFILISLIYLLRRYYSR